MGGFFYGRYTKEQVERANQVDLEELLLRSGEKLLRSGREKRLESDHSVTIRGNEWYDHAAEEGGFALSFARKHFGLSFQEAMALLLGENGQAPLPTAKPKPIPEPVKPFALPPAAGNQRRVFGYLLGTRQIDRAVLSAFVRKGLIYEDLPYHNAVFVGMDAAGVPRHARRREAPEDLHPLREPPRETSVELSGRHLRTPYSSGCGRVCSRGTRQRHRTVRPMSSRAVSSRTMRQPEAPPEHPVQKPEKPGRRSVRNLPAALRGGWESAGPEAV